jgi:alkylated DNA repair dioxygenase AlkB
LQSLRICTYFTSTHSKWAINITKSCRNGKHVGYRLVERPTDVSDVIDVDNPDSLSAAGTTLLEQSNLPNLPLPKCRVFTFPGCPGLVFFRKCLSPDLQRRLTVQCLTRFPAPPAHTNFNRSLGRSLPSGLWNAAQAGLHLGPIIPETKKKEEEESDKKEESNHSSSWVEGGDGTPAATLLKKLRWSSIGLIYDWTRRIYVSEWGCMPLPEELATLATKLVHIASLATTATTAIDDKKINNATSTKVSSAPNFTPDAALINYYHEGDTLNGHIDDAEPDMSQPLVSLSIGRPGIFLIGGFTRDVQPIPVLLRSGDAVILAGDSRRCYHGVPRIFPLKISSNREGVGGGGEGEKHVNGSFQKKGKAMQRELLGPEREKTDWGDGIDSSDVDFTPFEKHMNGCRINISVRSVGGGGAAAGEAKK